MRASQGHSGADWRYLLLWLATLGVVLLVFGPVWLRPVGFALGGLVLYCAALLTLGPLRRRRPPAWIVRSTASLAMLAVPVWIASLVLVVDCVTAPNAFWSFGRGAITRVTLTGTFGAARPTGLHVRFEPDLLGVIEMGYIAVSCGPAGSSREEVWPLWPLAAGTAIPAVILRRLRRERIPPGECEHCDYDLRGNVSGRCPECGRRIARATPRAT